MSFLNSESDIVKVFRDLIFDTEKFCNLYLPSMPHDMSFEKYQILTNIEKMTLKYGKNCRL